ncbi:MAG: hypothetical protein HYZ81_04440 [Nitrospinae bacterium]|nr:hypothetical protein [Nitrospinota bacterium]
MRFRREKGRLGIEKSSSKVHMVEIESIGGGFKVLQYAVIEYLPDGERWAVAQVKEALAKKRFRAKIARAALSGPTLHHRIIPLPPMTTREMDVVVQREVRREMVSSAERFAYDFQIIGESEEPALKRSEGPLALAVTEAERVELLAGGVKRREVLVATAPRRMAEAQRAFAEQCGLRLESLTTIPLTLVNLLQSMESVTAQRGIGFLYLRQHAGHLVIVNRGRFRFSREFPLGEKVQEEGLAGSEIGQEVGQTLVDELR